MKLITEKMITPQFALPRDTLSFTYTSVKGEVFRHSELITRQRTINYVKIFEAEEFEGVRDCYIWVIGEK